jgi:hypothetical protein
MEAMGILGLATEVVGIIDLLHSWVDVSFSIQHISMMVLTKAEPRVP